MLASIPKVTVQRGIQQIKHWAQSTHVAPNNREQSNLNGCFQWFLPPCHCKQQLHQVSSERGDHTLPSTMLDPWDNTLQQKINTLCGCTVSFVCFLLREGNCLLSLFFVRFLNLDFFQENGKKNAQFSGFRVKFSQFIVRNLVVAGKSKILLRTFRCGKSPKGNVYYSVLPWGYVMYVLLM